MTSRIRPALRALLLAAAASLPASAGLAQSPYQGQSLTIASFGGAIDETFQKAMVGFEEEYGVTLSWVPGTSGQNAAKAVASKGNPEFDVVMIDDVGQFGVSAMGDVFADIDTAIVTNYEDIRPQAQLGDGVSIGFNFTGLFYNTEEFEANGWAPPTSWDDLYRPEFCNQVGFLHPNVSYTINLMMLDAGGDPEKVPESIAKMATLKDCVATLEPSSAKLEEKIQLGEYVIGTHGVVRIIPLKAAGYPVEFVIPEEGTTLSSTTVSVARGGNEDLAQEMVNWLLTPEAQTILMENAYYIPAHSEVRPTEELAALGMPQPDVLEDALDPDRLAIAEHRREWSEAFERAMAR